MEHLDISISGSIQKNNFELWKQDLLEQISLTNLELETDNDFAVASDNVKAFKSAEKTLKECKFKALAQSHDIQRLFLAIDEVTETARETRLILERQVRTKKQQIKSDLTLKAQQRIVEYCKSKSEPFSYLDSTQFTALSNFEAPIKGKSSLTGVEKALDDTVKALKAKIDSQEQLAQESYQFISHQDIQHRMLFQDMQYLLSLSFSELKLTVENRIVRLSEQQAIQNAQASELELKAVSNEAVHGIQNDVVSDYVVAVDVHSTRAEAIAIAKEIKHFLAARTQVSDVKLSKQRS